MKKKKPPALTKTNIEKQMRKETQLYKPCKGFYTTLQENFRGTHEVACEFRGLWVYTYADKYAQNNTTGDTRYKLEGNTISVVESGKGGVKYEDLKALGNKTITP